jgi:hypothetical protein
MGPQSDFLLAHALFPEFPSISALLLIVVVVGGLVAALAWRWRARAARVEASAWPWQVPVVAFIVCALAVPLSFMPLLDLLGSGILLPGYLLLWILAFRNVLPENAGVGTAIIIAGGFSWALWTAVGLIISSAINRFRGGATTDLDISGSGALSILERGNSSSGRQHPSP